MSVGQFLAHLALLIELGTLLPFKFLESILGLSDFKSRKVINVFKSICASLSSFKYHWYLAKKKSQWFKHEALLALNRKLHSSGGFRAHVHTAAVNLSAHTFAALSICSQSTLKHTNHSADTELETFFIPCSGSRLHKRREGLCE